MQNDKTIELIDTLIYQELFHHYFQPLYYLDDWSLLGYEAFLRCDYQSYDNIESLFGLARKYEKLNELDMTSIRKAMTVYHRHQNSITGNTLFLNVYPSTLKNQQFIHIWNELTEQMYMTGKRIVLEINEAEEITDYALMRRIIRPLREKGVLFALDDLGKGAASLKALIELEPEFVKLDRYFANDLSISPAKQKMVQSILYYCQDQIQVVLEGIEHSRDLSMAKALGVHIGQGYLLGKPHLL